MAKFGKIDLGISELENLCGAGFELNKVASIDFVLSSDQNCKVIMQKDSNVIIIQIKNKISNWNELLDYAYLEVQKCLDILAISKRYFHSLPTAHYDNLLWVREDKETTIRLQNSSGFNIRSEFFWEKTSAADGFKSSSNDLPLPDWHEAFRYFRYSQLRDDLYTAYREAFLAVESLLSSYTPLKKESETAWHTRANRQLEVAGLDFGQIINISSTDPVATFVSEQFKAQRCAHFHAKAGNGHFLPGVLSDRHLVTDALEKLGRYFSEASRIICGAHSMIGVLTLGGMNMQIETFANELLMAVSPEFQPVNIEDTKISPNGLPVTNLETSYEGIIDGLGYEFGFLGKIDVNLMESTLIETIATFVPDTLLTRGNIPLLDLNGVDKFEYRQVFYFASNAGLKGSFSL